MPASSNNNFNFCIIALINLIINLDHGILPAISIEMQQQLQVNDQYMGLLGSLVYLGIVLSGVFAGHIILKIGAKPTMLISLTLISFDLALFSMQIQQVEYYLALRFLIGLFQVLNN